MFRVKREEKARFVISSLGQKGGSRGGSLVLRKMGGCCVYRVRMIGIKPCLGSWDVGRGEVVGGRESQRLSFLVGDAGWTVMG